MVKSLFREPAFAIMRGAMFPMSSLRDLTGASRAIEALNQPDDILEDSIQADVRSTHERIAAWLSRPDVAEALFVASASASDGADAAARGRPSALRGAKLGRFYRYAGRFAGRPTPFGVSSGYALVRCGPTTALELARAAIRRTRLDAIYLRAVWEIVARPHRSKFHYRANATLYQAADHYSMLTSHADGSSGAPEYTSVELERSPALDRVVGIARSAPCTYGRLIEAATGDSSGVSRDVGEGFIDELIDAQVLQCTEAPSAVGAELVEQLGSALVAAPPSAAADLLALLADTEVQLERWDLAQRPIAKADYVSLRDQLVRSVPGANPSCVFHVDARLAMASDQIDRAVVARLIDAAVVMATLVGPPWVREMQRFRDKFEARFGRQTVPLLRLFDPDEGIGFPRQDRDDDAAALAYTHVFARCRTSDGEVVLSKHDAAALVSHSQALVPDAFSIHATLLPRTTPDGPIAVLHGIRGPTYAWAAGRFCHGDDELREALAAQLRAEEDLRPDVAFVEIVHLPSARAGNFASRPKLRSCCVRLFSGGTDSEDLSLDDLQVFVDQRVHLWSQRLGKEVVLRHSCALDLNSGHELFAFLQAVEAEGTICRAVFDLGAFTPRVRLGDVVLQPASWSMPPTEAQAMLDDSACGRYRRIQAYRQLYKIPRWVRVGSRDQTLVIDFEHPVGCDEALRLLSSGPGARIFETIEDIDEGVLRGSGGSHVHDLVIPVLREVSRCPTGSPRPPAPRAAASHRFLPGSDWLAAHIYCASHVAEQILTARIAPLVALARESRRVRRWFFTRYTDPDLHLRIRFLMASELDHAALLSQLNATLAPYVASGAVWRVCADTYDREVERYGGPESIDIVERMFEIDSDFVAAALAPFRNDDDRPARWELALLGIHQAVQAVGLAPAARLDLLKRCRAAWAPRGPAGADAERIARSTFQSRRDELLQILRDDGASMIDRRLWARRLGRMQDEASQLRSMQGNATLEGVLESFIHMHVNRVLAPDSDFSEFRLYDALSRTYRLDVGRRAAGQAPAVP